MARVNTSKNKVTYVAIVVGIFLCTLGVGTLGYTVWNKNPTLAPVVSSQEKTPRQEKPKQTPPPKNQTLPLSKLPKQPNNGTLFVKEHQEETNDDNDVTMSTGGRNNASAAEPTTPIQNSGNVNSVQQNPFIEFPEYFEESTEDQDFLDPSLLNSFKKYINQHAEAIENLIKKVEEGCTFKKFQIFNQDRILVPEINLELAAGNVITVCAGVLRYYKHLKESIQDEKDVHVTDKQNSEMVKNVNANKKIKLVNIRNKLKKELIKQCKAQFKQLHNEAIIYNKALDNLVVMIKSDFYVNTDIFSTEKLTKQQWIDKTIEFIIEKHSEVINAIIQVEWFQFEVNMIEDDEQEKTKAIEDLNDGKKTLFKYREAVKKSIINFVKEKLQESHHSQQYVGFK